MPAYTQPLRHIFDVDDHRAWVASPTHAALLDFVASLASAVQGKPTTAPVEVSEPCAALVHMLEAAAAWVDDIPPIRQATRYGNKAYRSWNARMVAAAEGQLTELLATAPAGVDTAGIEVELLPYWYDAFGNATRIDYGTGHETNFIIFLYCLKAAGVLSLPRDALALGLRVFPCYIATVRKLQRTYWLEPAGSHGVWSLDDYQFLVFLLGASQLVGHRHIKPRSIHSSETRENFKDAYMYLDAIAFICEVKRGAPFGEHSPLLDDASALPDWARVGDGLFKMYKGEVLGKLPVVQHLVFGSLFPATWQSSKTPVPSESMLHASAVLESGGAVVASPALPVPRAGGGGGAGGGLGIGAPAALTGVAPWAMAAATRDAVLPPARPAPPAVVAAPPGAAAPEAASVASSGGSSSGSGEKEEGAAP